LTPIKDRVPSTHRDDRGNKRCSTCRDWKATAAFPTGRGQDGLSTRCARCIRDISLRKLYGITSDDYDLLLARQNGGCAICGRTSNLSGRLMAVDHDHDTDEVRGILCENCNFGIGSMQDSPALLIKAAEYLSD